MNHSDRLARYTNASWPSLPEDNPHAAAGGAPRPECTAAPRLSSADRFRDRLLPILFVPSDRQFTDATAEQHLGDRLIQSLERVQKWYGDRLSDPESPRRGFHLDRVAVVHGSQPTAYYYCSGQEQCDPALAPRRIAAELAESGLPALAAHRRQLVLVVGGGPLLATIRRSDGAGATALVGDAVEPLLGEPCFVRLVEGATSCDMSMQGADWIFAQATGRVLGLTGNDGVLGKRALEAATGVGGGPVEASAGIDLSGEQREALADSAMLTEGDTLVAGRLHVAADPDLVNDIAVGADSALVVWHQPTGLRVGDNAIPPGTLPPRAQDDIEGMRHTRLMARLVRFGDGTEATMEPAVVIAEGPAPTSANRRPIRNASVAYDAQRNEYQIVYYKRQSGDNASVMGRRVSATTGSTTGPEQVLAQRSLYLGFTDIYSSPQNDSFLVAWAGGCCPGIGAGGSPLEVARLSGDGTTLSTPRTLFAGDAKYPRIAHDSNRDRFLVTWNDVETRYGPDLLAHFVNTSGQPIAPNGTPLAQPQPIVVQDIRFWNGSAEPAYDPTTDQWLVGYWHNGDLGSWDIISQRLDGGTGALIGDPIVTSSGPHYYNYDPSLVFIPSSNLYFMSFGGDDWDDGHGFWDGLGYVNGQLIEPDGSNHWGQLLLHQEYEAFERSEAAAHLNEKLAVVAHSGLSGVYVDIIRFMGPLDPGELDPPPVEVVGGGLDEDDDGLTDCEDPDVADAWECSDFEPVEADLGDECTTVFGYPACGFTADEIKWLRELFSELPCTYADMNLEVIYRLDETQWLADRADTATIDCNGTTAKVVGGYRSADQKIWIRAQAWTSKPTVGGLQRQYFKWIMSHELTHAWSNTHGKHFYLTSSDFCFTVPITGTEVCWPGGQTRNVGRDFAFDSGEPYDYERCYPCQQNAQTVCDCYAARSAEEAHQIAHKRWWLPYYMQVATGWGEDFAETISRFYYINDDTKWVGPADDCVGNDCPMTECTPTTKESWIADKHDEGTCGSCENGACEFYGTSPTYPYVDDGVSCPATSVFDPGSETGYEADCGAGQDPRHRGEIRAEIEEDNYMQTLRFQFGSGCGAFTFGHWMVTLLKDGEEHNIASSLAYNGVNHRWTWMWPCASWNNSKKTIDLGGWKPPYTIKIQWSGPNSVTLGYDDLPALEPKVGTGT